MRIRKSYFVDSRKSVEETIKKFRRDHRKRTIIYIYVVDLSIYDPKLMAFLVSSKLNLVPVFDTKTIH